MSIRVYPVIKQEYHTEYYKIKINGVPVNLDSARISAYPFNRRWPGHQRPIEQSEIINFLSFSMDETVEMEIIPKYEFKDVEIRPKRAGIKYRIESGVIKIRLNAPQYFTVEPFGRKHALHIFADKLCDYNTEKNNADVIYFGAGEHDVGVLHLRSNQTVFIDEGAVVYGCIYARDAQNIKILGSGILDNSRNKEKILFEINAENNDEDVRNAERMHTIQTEYCSGIMIKGITIRDSLVYNIRPIACKDIEISNVKIIGCWRYNSDGIDMHNCENVHISDCFIRTYDDSICVKGFDFYQNEDDMYYKGRNYDFFKNITVERCVIWNDWGKCLEIGAETRAKTISQILFKDCDIIHITHMPLDCMNVDYAHVYNVIYENISVEYDELIPEPKIQRSDSESYESYDPDYTPYLIVNEIVFQKEYSAGGKIRGKNYNFIYKNIYLYGRQMPKIKISGYDKEHQCENIIISDLYWNDKKIENINDIQFECNEYCHNIQIR